MPDARTTARGAAGFAAFIAIVSIAPPVVAQEYCVACTGPHALYRCVLEQARPSGIPLKSLCVRTLAREGRHIACAIRSGTVFDCDAPIKRIDAVSAAEQLKGSTVPLPTATAIKGTPPAPPPTVVVTPGAPPETAPQREATAPPRPVEVVPPPRPVEMDEQKRGDDRGAPPSKPKTVEALAKSISRSSKESLNQAGAAIESTTRKTWNCLASFFKSC